MTKSRTIAPQDTTSSSDVSARAERALNAAILDADISRSYEEFIAIVDTFYAENVEVRSDSASDALIGREHVKSKLLTVLVPIHVMAEIEGLSVRVAETPIASDSIDQQHSQWSLELVGVTGRAVRLGWSVRRRWKNSRVVDEYYYDHHQEGEALGPADFRSHAFNEED